VEKEFAASDPFWRIQDLSRWNCRLPPADTGSPGPDTEPAADDAPPGIL